MKEPKPLLQRVFPQEGALRHVREALFILGAYLVYMFIRNYIVSDIEVAAFANAARTVSFEQAGGLFREAAWQSWTIAHSEPLIIFMNWTYVLTFGPIISVVAVIIYVKDRPKYLHYRNVLLISFIIAMIAFAAFPLAPPRFLPEYGFVDTIRHLGPAWWIGHSWYGSPDTAVYFNVFAAWPSIHFAWTIMFGIIFLSMKSRLVKLCGVVYPTMTFFAIVLTGNHYIVDAIGGAAVTVSSILIYSLLLRLRFHGLEYLTVAREYQGRLAGRFNDSAESWRTRWVFATAKLRARLKVDRVSGGKWNGGLPSHRA